MFNINKGRLIVTGALFFFLILPGTVFSERPSPASEKTSPGIRDSRVGRDKRAGIRNAHYMASLLARAGKFEEAAEIYHGLSDTLKWGDGRAGYLYAEAQAYWASGNYSRAQEIFLHISDRGSEGLHAAIPEARSEERENRRLKIILKFWIDIDRARFALATNARIQGNTAQAVKIYKSIQEESPYVENQRRAVFALARIEKRQGNSRKSLRLLEKLLTGSTGTDFPSHQGYPDMHFLASGEDAMGQGFGLVPPEERFLVDKEKILLFMSDIYAENKDGDKIIETYETLVKNAKGGTVRQTYLYLLAKAYADAGLPEKARNAYTTIIRQEEDRLAVRRKFFGKDREKERIPLKMGVVGQMAQQELKHLTDKQ